MNDYERKQADKKVYYAEKALKLRQEADRTYQQACDWQNEMPLGQPILVGHHSENKHRNFLKKIQNHFLKANELYEKAEHYERKAATVPNAISSDDEDAIKKLKLKLEGLIVNQERMKEINRLYRKKGEAFLEELTDIEKKAVLNNFAYLSKFTVTKKLIPFPSYVLSNNNQNICNTKKRIEVLKARQSVPECEPIYGNGYTLKEDKSDNRILFIFESKPSDEKRTILKRNGFKWSPTRSAWIRMLNQNGRWAAGRVVDLLNELDS